MCVRVCVSVSIYQVYGCSQRPDVRVLDTLELDLQVSGCDFLNVSAGDQTQVPWEQWVLLTMEPFVQPPLLLLLFLI